MMESHDAIVNPAATGKGGWEDVDDETSFMTAQELITAHMVSMTVKAAMELGLIDALAAAPAGRALTAAELVARLPTANKAEAAAAVDRMLKFLACHGVVKCAMEEGAEPGGGALRRYAPAPVCRWLSSGINFGGKERTERELTRLAMDAGFCGTVRSTFVFGGYWALEFTK
ncbi:hypothetical protein ACP4OV_020188 [Aristida adscensionis]